MGVGVVRVALEALVVEDFGLLQIGGPIVERAGLLERRGEVVVALGRSRDPGRSLVGSDRRLVGSCLADRAGRLRRWRPARPCCCSRWWPGHRRPSRRRARRRGSWAARLVAWRCCVDGRSRLGSLPGRAAKREDAADSEKGPAVLRPERFGRRTIAGPRRAEQAGNSVAGRGRWPSDSVCAGPTSRGPPVGRRDGGNLCQSRKNRTNRTIYANHPVFLIVLLCHRPVPMLACIPEAIFPHGSIPNTGNEETQAVAKTKTSTKTKIAARPTAKSASAKPKASTGQVGVAQGPSRPATRK